ncbi:MAG: lysozyme inhibitor LprI family protein [Hyphomonas sp.]
MNRLWPQMASGAALLALLAPCAHAYGYPPVEEEVAAHVEVCIAKVVDGYEDGAKCVGIIFNACEGNAGTTYSMSACYMQERDFWQSMIDQTLPEVLKAYDADDRRTISGEPLSDSLAKSQDAWTVHMQAQCRFAYDEMGTGSMRNITAGVCFRNLTAERALFLRGLNAQR